MEKFTEDDIKDAREFGSFYVNTLENHRESFAYYLSETAVLDWFGQTVRGIKNIGVFLKNNVANVKHNFANIEPCSKIGFRDTHIVEYSTREITNCTTIIVNTDSEKTPPNILSPGGSRKREKGQGDGLHNCTTDSPIKKTRLTGDAIVNQLTPPVTPSKIYNITSDGHIEFHRRSSKKYQRETKWSRPCKLMVSFSKTQNDYVIHLIIYQGNMKCRRNLLKEFDASETE